MLTTAQIIDRILQLNPTCTEAWLAGFSRTDLEQYLAKLQYAAEPRGARSSWVRRGDAPAVVTRRPAA